jgi:hypothetical protein
MGQAGPARYSARPMSPPVGADVESLCSKCGDVWHVIVAKVGDRIARVICKECNGQHAYRNPKGTTPPAKRAASTAKPRAARSEKVVERFPTPAVAADLSREVRTYKATELFEVGDRVEHPTFGQGVVEISEPGKVTMFFAVGRKVLVQARNTPAGALARPRPFIHAGPGLPPPKSNAAPVAAAATDDEPEESEDGGN